MPPRRRRRVHPLSLFYFVVTLGLLVWISTKLDRGPTVLAVVNGKLEEMQYSFAPQASWYRWFRLGVAFTTPDGMASSATITVPEDRFDALNPGDTIAIRYLAAFPLIARAADRSTFTVVRELGARAAGDHVLAPLLLWIGAGFVSLWVASYVSTVLVFVVGGVWIAAAFPLMFPPPDPVVMPPTEGRARVVASSLVDRAPERRTTRRRSTGFGREFRRLDTPYHVVQLRVPLPGRADSVLAIDAVDSGSVAGLAPNAIVPIRYDARRPREARLRDAARTFAATNRYHMVIPVVGCGILGILAAWGARDARGRKRRRETLSTAQAS